MSLSIHLGCSEKSLALQTCVSQMSTKSLDIFFSEKKNSFQHYFESKSFSSYSHFPISQDYAFSLFYLCRTKIHKNDLSKRKLLCPHKGAYVKAIFSDFVSTH